MTRMTKRTRSAMTTPMTEAIDTGSVGNKGSVKVSSSTKTSEN